MRPRRGTTATGAVVPALRARLGAPTFDAGALEALRDVATVLHEDAHPEVRASPARLFTSTLRGAPDAYRSLASRLRDHATP